MRVARRPPHLQYIQQLLRAEKDYLRQFDPKLTPELQSLLVLPQLHGEVKSVFFRRQLIQSDQQPMTLQFGQRWMPLNRWQRQSEERSGFGWQQNCRLVRLQTTSIELFLYWLRQPVSS